jgi:20S proteasome alpha/beta subunit
MSSNILQLTKDSSLRYKPKPIPRPTPNPPRPKLDPGRKRVTIAAGFRCSDGIVIGADTQEGTGDSKTLARSKIRTIDQENYAVAFTGAASDAHYLDSTVEEIIRNLHPADSLIDIENTISKQLRNVYQEHVRPNSKAFGDRGFDLLVGACLRDRSRRSPLDQPTAQPDSFRLWASHDSVVVPVTTYQFLGTGGPITNYLGERLYDPSLTARQGVSLAIQVLRHAKAYGTGCGGRSDIYILNDRGVSPVDSSVDVPRIDAGFEAIERAMAPLLLEYLDPLVMESQFEQEFSRFATEVRRLRAEYVELIESRARERLDLWD